MPRIHFNMKFFSSRLVWRPSIKHSLRCPMKRGRKEKISFAQSTFYWLNLHESPTISMSERLCCGEIFAFSIPSFSHEFVFFKSFQRSYEQRRSAKPRFLCNGCFSLCSLQRHSSCDGFAVNRRHLHDEYEVSWNVSVVWSVSLYCLFASHLKVVASHSSNPEKCQPWRWHPWYGYVARKYSAAGKLCRIFGAEVFLRFIAACKGSLKKSYQC